MRNMGFSEAIDDALGQAMAADSRILLLGEDVQGMHGSLFARFGRHRVRNTPISCSITPPNWRPSQVVAGARRWWCAQLAVAATVMAVNTSKACGDGWLTFRD
jgi:hypothetical protein